ncbi:unnamed protein product [Phytophthora fragariaefolia]|uniref:Unnamed protein product n=1 Tax=Phytophthora fragariaefolia TaxID=1490495 RepID=A0A9W7CZ54_9STRA|nr:unnamed protein product [Phytophthora fragariaefolia]
MGRTIPDLIWFRNRTPLGFASPDPRSIKTQSSEDNGSVRQNVRRWDHLRKYRPCLLRLHDLTFYPLGGNAKEVTVYIVKTAGHLIPNKVETLEKDVPRYMLSSLMLGGA